MNHPNLPVFISHAERDAAYLAQFGLHLKNLEKLQLLRVWHSGLIPVGANRQAQIQSQLDEAQIILLLLSPDFLAAPHTWQQLERALQRRDEENVLLLPIYLRPCYWQDHENLR
ncbi:MAG: toll/interleukin-1 receptor domain-containing protein, partial [Bacteroidota bacterium]